MNRKLIGILIIIIGLVILAGIIYVMFFYDFSNLSEEKVGDTQEASEQTQEISTKTQPKRAVINIEQQSQTVEGVTEEDLKQIAISFAERFGSYSNQANYGNIRDLKIFMSSTMQAWADNYIQNEISKNINSSIYIGMTTKAVSGETQQFDDDFGKAKILVSTQRRMATGTTSNIVSFQQDIIISFVKERGAWKVDSADWQETI